jgi:Lrp/AsnC family transcriptional regulator, leucine-responsive regulatory protein
VKVGAAAWRAGIITGYRLEIDPAAIGLPITAFARIRRLGGQLAKVTDLARSLPQITECPRRPELGQRHG